MTTRKLSLLFIACWFVFPRLAYFAGPVPSTNASFTFMRDDTTRGSLTTVRIDASRIVGASIDQNVFGNFLEHLGGTVYEGVWAEALLNPNLERIEESDKSPQDWEMIGTAEWREDGYHSPRSVRLSGPNGALAQTITLPLQRTRGYALSLFLRAPDGQADIFIGLEKVSGNSGTQVETARIHVAGQDWRRKSIHWTLPADAFGTENHARFVIVHRGGNPIDVDQIQLLPDDAVDGIDPDVLRASRTWHIPTLRWPGGNFVSGYRWQHGIGPRDRRPTRKNAAWGGVETNHFGTEEFLDFARRIGATPQFEVNAGDGSPEDAAAWVRYCNRDTLRVPIWEIGNELYGHWQIGHTDDAGNAERFVRFRDAMRKVDPRIKIMATGKGNEYHPDAIRKQEDWDEAVLSAAVANGGKQPDYLTIHPLVGMPGDLRDRSYAEQWDSAMAQPAFVDRTLLPGIEALISKVEGHHPQTRIAPTEWGMIIDGKGWQKAPNHDSEAGAVFNALTLNAFLRHSSTVTLANMTALTHGGGIKKWNGIVTVDPQYYTQQLYALAAPRYAIETHWTGPAHDVPQRGFLPAVKEVPDIDIFSALNGRKSRLIVFLVNRSLQDMRAVQISVRGFSARNATATILSSSDPRAKNTWDHPFGVIPQAFPLTSAFVTGAGTALIPAHSFVLLTFSR